MLRHEQQTVRMALAAAFHHSAGPLEKVEMQQNGAPRGQKTAARAGKEVEYKKHAGLRAQKTPPPGERPDFLAEPGPQRSDRTVRRSSAETPLLVVASLAAAAADGVDAATLSFLMAQALEDRRKDEEERKMKEKEAQEVKLKELEARWRAVVRELDTLLLVLFERRSDQEEDRVVKLQKLRERPSRERSAILLAPSKRKKKKKRKKKLPKSSSFLRLSRCSSRCVPSCCRLQACDARHHGRFGPEVQLRRHWWHAWLVLLCDSAPCAVFPSLSSGPRCSASRPVWTRRNITCCCAGNCGLPQSQFLAGRRFPVAVQRLISMVLLFSRP